MTKFVVDTHDCKTRRDGRGFGKHDKDRHKHRVIQFLTVKSFRLIPVSLTGIFFILVSSFNGWTPACHAGGTGS